MAAARGVGGAADGSRLEGTRAFNRARRYLKYPDKNVQCMNNARCV